MRGSKRQRKKIAKRLTPEKVERIKAALLEYFKEHFKDLDIVGDDSDPAVTMAVVAPHFGAVVGMINTNLDPGYEAALNKRYATTEEP